MRERVSSAIIHNSPSPIGDLNEETHQDENRRRVLNTLNLLTRLIHFNNTPIIKSALRSLQYTNFVHRRTTGASIRASILAAQHVLRNMGGVMRYENLKGSQHAFLDVALSSVEGEIHPDLLASVRRGAESGFVTSAGIALGRIHFDTHTGDRFPMGFMMATRDSLAPLAENMQEVARFGSFNYRFGSTHFAGMFGDEALRAAEKIDFMYGIMEENERRNRAKAQRPTELVCKNLFGG